MMSDDRRMLDLAARLAWRARGFAEPNPIVGAVIVRDGRIIGAGHHRAFGNLHAEREALENCRTRGEDPRGATLYVTLEPCCHHGKQPPCTDAVVEAGITSVVAARHDPGETSGGGAEVLRRAGIGVRFTDASRMAQAILNPFVVRTVHGRPWVIAKWAQTMDGRIATRSGESQWISNACSRRRVHQLRGRCDVIMTAIGTVLADDPKLTARGVAARRLARRVVIDRDAELPLECALAATARAVPTEIICREPVDDGARARLAALEEVGVPHRFAQSQGDRMDLRSVLAALPGDSTHVMLEAGPRLLGSFFEADLVDEVVVYVAPTLFGDAEAKPAVQGRSAATLASGLGFELVRMRPCAGDVELTYLRSGSRT